MESTQPIIVLVRTQMGENIGMCARAMLNCGLKRLRLVDPRDGWPNDRANATAADADVVIDAVECFDSVRDAVADCTRVYATTARSRAGRIPAVEVSDAVPGIKSLPGECAILFGPEASGLDNDDLSYADRLLDFPVNPEFSSLNLAQAVLLFGWEYWRGEVEVVRKEEPNATKETVGIFLDRLEAELDKGGFFLSEEMRPSALQNLRTLFSRSNMTERELQMMHGVVTALVTERKTGEEP